jgi:hypothetical protein
MTLLQLLGLLGGALFAGAGIPAAVATWRARRSVGTPISVAWLVIGGTLVMFAYLTASHGLDWVIAVNYAVELASWLVIAWFHYLPRVADAFRLTFETRDAGRVWRFQGETLPASPLTDKLQDAHTNIAAGLPVGADAEARERALRADRNGWARRFQAYPEHHKQMGLRP